MRSQKTMKFALFACLSIALVGPMKARAASDPAQAAAYQFPTAAVVNGEPLVLNGAGAADAMGVRALMVGLYLRTPQSSLDGIVAGKGAKRLQFYFLRDTSARETSNALLDRLRQNITKDEFAANIVPISQLGGVFGTRTRFARGDEIRIDYSPATQSTDFYLNKVKFGDTIQGESFYGVMLKVFLRAS